MTNYRKYLESTINVSYYDLPYTDKQLLLKVITLHTHDTFTLHLKHYEGSNFSLYPIYG